jgi:hypothetical protein
MEKQIIEFDWSESPSHVRLLSVFRLPRIILQVSRWTTFPNLKEPIRSAIERFANSGMLRQCTLGEMVSVNFKVGDLKARCKELGIKQSGSKEELIARLLQLDHQTMEKLFENTIMHCLSDKGIAFIQSYNQLKDAALAETKQDIYQRIVEKDLLGAAKIYKKYSDSYEDNENNPFYSYRLSVMKNLLDCMPNSLVEKYSSNLLFQLKVIALMGMVWPPSGQWLPYDLELNPIEADKAIQLLTRYSEYYESIRELDMEDTIAILFDKNDIEVCDSCRQMNNKKYKIDQIQEWPFPGCENPIGCLPMIDYWGP